MIGNGDGFVVYLRVECTGDKEMRRKRMCSGARKVLAKIQKPDGAGRGADALWFSLPNSSLRGGALKATVVDPRPVQQACQTRQLSLGLEKEKKVKEDEI